MITKFDSSYVGTVDMENLGYTGTPINERHYSNEQLAGASPTRSGWIRSATTLSGWRSTISSPRARNAFQTC